jgi:Peptidase A4 family
MTMPLAQKELLNAGFQFDEEKFLAKIPYKLVPTNRKGVYAHVGPPDDFDPNTATQHELLKHGILVRKPTANDPEHLRKAWDTHFSRKWLAKDRIVPEFGLQFVRSSRPKPDAIYPSTNWSGAVGSTGTWSSVVGSWTVPFVSKPSEPLVKEKGWSSVTWVGLDGWNSSDVLQCGSGQVYYDGKASVYWCWYEWFAPPEPGDPPHVSDTGITNFAVKPGDKITCAAQYVGTTAGSLSVNNATTGQHFSITVAPPPGAAFLGNSYEWIMEAPDGGETVSSLPDFSPVVFTGSSACGPNNVFATPANADITYIQTPAGKVLTSVTTGVDTLTIDFIG